MSAPEPLCALCHRPIPARHLEAAPLHNGAPVHPGCLRKAQGRPAR